MTKVMTKVEILKNESNLVKAKLDFNLNLLNIAKFISVIIPFLMVAEIIFMFTTEVSFEVAVAMLCIAVFETIFVTAAFFTSLKLEKMIKEQKSRLSVIYDAIEPREMCKKFTGKLVETSSTRFVIGEDIELRQATFEKQDGGLLRILIEPFQIDRIRNKDMVTLELTSRNQLVKGLSFGS